ncbi:MAG: hypothetical protein HRU19_26040 [Pseudobacteriovorax sp.]|nr:hypothetical protein [Pseudobacteriovorax sp.]
MKTPSTESGLTLLEVIFAIMILLTLTIAAAQMIRTGVDVQISLSERARVQHRLDVSIQKITSDLEHAFMVNRKRAETFYTERRFKTHFSIDQQSNSAILKLTTMNNKPTVAASRESDQNFVIYKIERDLETGLSNLVRAESDYIPNDFDVELPFKLLAKNIKSLQIEAWNGDRWVEEWDSDKSDFRDLLPHMVTIKIEAFALDYPEGERASEPERDPVEVLRTIVFIPSSGGGKEPKSRPSSPKIF